MKTFLMDQTILQEKLYQFSGDVSETGISDDGRWIIDYYTILSLLEHEHCGNYLFGLSFFSVYYYVYYEVFLLFN